MSYVFWTRIKRLWTNSEADIFNDTVYFRLSLRSQEALLFNGWLMLRLVDKNTVRCSHRSCTEKPPTHITALGFSQRLDNQMRQTASLPSSVLVFSPLFSVEGVFHKALHLNAAVWENGTVEIYKDWFVLSELIRFYVEASLSAALIF